MVTTHRRPSLRTGLGHSCLGHSRRSHPEAQRTRRWRRPWRGRLDRWSGACAGYEQRRRPSVRRCHCPWRRPTAVGTAAQFIRRQAAKSRCKQCRCEEQCRSPASRQARPAQLCLWPGHTGPYFSGLTGLAPEDIGLSAARLAATTVPSGEKRRRQRPWMVAQRCRVRGCADVCLRLLDGQRLQVAAVEALSRAMTSRTGPGSQQPAFTSQPHRCKHSRTGLPRRLNLPTLPSPLQDLLLPSRGLKNNFEFVLPTVTL